MGTNHVRDALKSHPILSGRGAGSSVVETIGAFSHYFVFRPVYCVCYASRLRALRASIAAKMRPPRSTLYCWARCLIESRENDVHRTKTQTFFCSVSKIRQTQVQNLSHGDETNMSNAMFVNNTIFVARQSSHVLLVLVIFLRLCWSFVFHFFGLEVE